MQVGHDNPGEPADVHLAALIAFHQLLEMLDSVNTLLSAGRGVGARPALRSMFEALISIEYILRDPAQFTERAFAFLAADLLQRLDVIEMVTPGTPEYAGLDKVREADEVASKSKIDLVPGLGLRNQLERVLAKPNWKVAADKLRALRKPGRPVPAWYKIDGGPQSIGALARAVGRGYQYAFIYRDLSATVHALDHTRVFRKSAGEFGFSRFPDSNAVKECYRLAIILGFMACKTVLFHYRGDERQFIWRWYRDEIKAGFDSVRTPGQQLEP